MIKMQRHFKFFALVCLLAISSFCLPSISFSYTYFAESNNQAGYATDDGKEFKIPTSIYSTKHMYVGFEDGVLSNTKYRAFVWYDLPSWLQDKEITGVVIQLLDKPVEMWDYEDDGLLNSIKCYDLGDISWDQFYNSDFGDSSKDGHWKWLGSGYYHDNLTASEMNFNIDPDRLTGKSQIGFVFIADPEDPMDIPLSDQSNRIDIFDHLNDRPPMLIINYTTPAQTRIIRLSGDLSFGDVTVGQSAQRTMTVHNDGNDTLTVTSVNYPDGFNNLSGDKGLISPGDSANVTIVFSPTSARVYGGNITIYSNATSGTPTISCSGTGVAPQPSFTGIEIRGASSINEGSSAEYTLYKLYSNGSEEKMTWTACPFSIQTGSAYADISRITTDYIRLYGKEVSSNKTVVLYASYLGKTDTHNITIVDIAPTLSSISISGPTQVNESASAQYTCTAFYSDGSSTSVTNSASWSEDSPYSSINSSGYLYTYSVSSNQACTITASYGGKTDTHNITINDVDVIVTRVISLSGDLSFGNVTVGQTAQSTMTITNTGNSTLTVFGIDYPNGFNGQNWSGTIPAGSSTNITVTFSPNAEQNYSGTITVNADQTGGNNTIACSGSGVPATSRIALINPDYYRVLKMGTLNHSGEYFSLANGTIPDNTEITDTENWSGVGECSDFISTTLEASGFQVDVFEAADLPDYVAGTYQAIIVQDPLREFGQIFPQAAEAALPDLLQYCTNDAFLNKLLIYFENNVPLVFIGDAVRLLEDGPGRLNFGKTVETYSVENTVSQPDTRLPDKWLFIRGNPFCGVDRNGSGQYLVAGGTIMPQGTNIGNLTLFDGNDKPWNMVWSDTLYFPTDAVSLMDVTIVGQGEYVLDGSVCNPTVYEDTVDDTVTPFAGYTMVGEQKVFFMGSDSFFDYQHRNYDGTSHANSYREIKFTVSDKGKQFLAKFVGMAVASIDDKDRDGVPDDEDVFPNDPTETMDTDNDGLGNNADLDDDNDGLPDFWENYYGTDPLVNDATDDPDADGQDNAAEYFFGTNPVIFTSNFPPYPPDLVYPANGAVDVKWYELVTGAFDDFDNDTHLKTRWQISTSDDFSELVLSVSDMKSLTSLIVPSLLLLDNSTYYWRAKFIDGRDAQSQWSETFSFITGSQGNDANKNGIPDDSEVSADSDVDGNGTPDNDQTDMKCVLSSVDPSQSICVKCDVAAGTIESIEPIDPADTVETGKPDEVPIGLVGFRLDLNNPGQIVEVQVLFSEPAPDGMTWYKYNSVDGWQDYSSHAIFSGDRKSVTIELQDGGYGDADGVENSVVIDPGGYGVIYPGPVDEDDDSTKDKKTTSFSGGGGGGGGGCFIGTIMP